MSRANQLGLKGWVRNNQDESVEGAAAGSTDQIDSL
jgi:acylphosphatase